MFLFKAHCVLPGPTSPFCPRLRQILELSRNRLEGWLSGGWLAFMGRLSRLSLHHNRFRGPLPAEVSRLRAAEYLLLNDNRLEGEVLAEHFEGLNPAMREVHLHGNRFFVEVDHTKAFGKTGGGGGVSGGAGGGNGSSEDEAEEEEEEMPSEKLAAAKEDLEDIFPIATILI